ncbi:DUF3611 family protein [Oscillatoria sp. FACHB-1407]|uniref:DUF3611 family protein n=1 Tax=Oscillatoria sp. FACHB-1407 TaxID=2692847 RepID=UPI001683D7C3|nr:DUF3611 family protein [Oscillatoria sp. FACHB-1407]MBD2460510.1 DUF3611 family protein [Oscillatoria sp. FACHB-1407]
METQTEPRSPELTLTRIATVLKIVGWLSFWVQLGLGVAAGLCLVFVISGRNVSGGGSPGIGIGVFWAIAGIAVLLFSLFLAFRLTRFARQLRHPNPERHPSRAAVMQFLQMVILTGVAGMLVTILGGGATLGVLLAKSIAQPQGVAIYDPQRIIRSLDIFVAMANMNGITAHFVGAITALGLFKWLGRF